MKKRPGMAGLAQKTAIKAQAQAIGSELNELDRTHMAEQLSVFKKNLETFAQKHRNAINKDPEFRRQFQEMCLQIGVDPLASNKGFWGQILGFGDFYFELGVQIIQVCLTTREQNGGLVDIAELLDWLRRMRSTSSQKISQYDVERAIKKLKLLGNGFDLLVIGRRTVVRSVPVELNQDHAAALGVAQDCGYFTAAVLTTKLGWSVERIDRTVKFFLAEGMVWIDEQAGERQYWFPTLFKGFAVMDQQPA